MNITIENQILEKVKKAKRGTLFFNDSFLSNENPEGVRKALQRLVKKGELLRVATGMYVRPEIDPVIGVVTPGVDAIAAVGCGCDCVLADAKNFTPLCWLENAPALNVGVVETVSDAVVVGGDCFGGNWS